MVNIYLFTKTFMNKILIGIVSATLVVGAAAFFFSLSESERDANNDRIEVERTGEDRPAGGAGLERNRDGDAYLEGLEAEVVSEIDSIVAEEATLDAELDELEEQTF